MLTVRMHPAPSPQNLYLTLLARSLEAHGVRVADSSLDPDVVHYHWLQAPFDAPTVIEAGKGVARSLFDLSRWRRRGAAIVWTVHNLDAHEGRWPGEALYMRRATTLLDGWLSLSSYAEQEALSRWPRLASVEHRVVPHGDLAHALPSAASTRASTRGSLGVGDDVGLVVFVGSVRAYKGVSDLIDATRTLRPRDVHVLVAGECRDPEVSSRADQEGVTVIDRRVGDAELVAFVEAADLVVLPFRRITHSGSLLTVAALGTPVLAPRIGALPELADALGPNVRLYDAPLDAGTVQHALTWARDVQRLRSPMLPGHDWDTVAAITADLYARAVDSRAARNDR